MSTEVKHRRGTTAEHASFTGAIAEITVDTTKKTAVVHDGATAGGMPLVRNTASETYLGNAATATNATNATTNAIVTGELGYVAGAGGTVTQITSKSTSVTINKICGEIVTHNASLTSGTAVYFEVANSFVGLDDVILVNQASGNLIGYDIDAVNNGIVPGYFYIVIKNNGLSGTLAEAIKLNFVVIKGVFT